MLFENGTGHAFQSSHCSSRQDQIQSNQHGGGHPESDRIQAGARVSEQADQRNLPLLQQKL